MPASLPSRSPWPRWGLLLVAVLLAIGLFWTALAGWYASNDASLALVRGRALDLADSIRRDMVDGPPSDAALGTLVDELSDRGLRYVAIVRPNGKVAAQAGQALGPPPRVEDQAPPTGGGIADPVPVGDGRYRFVVHPPAHRPFGRRHMRGPRGQMSPAAFIIELDPPEARAIRDRAATTLAVSAAVALMLLGTSIVLWRLGLRADRLAADLGRERQLAVLGEMSAVLGHEIRNPLASLKGHAQLLLEKLAPDHPGRRKAEIIVREAVRLEELSGHILSFARSGSVDRRPVDPAEVARAAAEELGDERVRLDTPAAMAAVALDRVRMEQVLVNLLRNACEASPPGELVDLSVRATDGEIVFEVRDRGGGFEATDAARIFEPFHTTRVQGTGLGLAVARRIVESHGGRVEARNHPDGGAVMRVALPVT